MEHYNVGDVVWAAKAGMKDVEKICPVCYGERSVTLILGNGDRVELECRYCAHGYGAACGKIYEWEYAESAERVTISEVRIELSESDERIQYVTTDNRVLGPSEVFTSEDEAKEAAKVMTAQLRIDQQTKAEYLKKNQARSYTWNAGYHLREAKRAEESAARHKECVKLCKAKAEA